jgi:Valyl-tRNA synthetase
LITKKMKKVFNPRNIEQKWYEQWESKNYFNADPKSKKPSFCIMIPPPNVTALFIWAMDFKTH